MNVMYKKKELRTAYGMHTHANDWKAFQLQVQTVNVRRARAIYANTKLKRERIRTLNNQREI